MTKVIYFLLSAILVCATDTRADPLLPESVAKLFESSPRISAQLLDPMPYTPVFRPDLGLYKHSVDLAPAQRDRLLKLLRDSQAIDPATRLKECRYLPGMIFTAEDGKANPQARRTSALLCFNCDVWALDEADAPRMPTEKDLLSMEPYKPSAISKFGDSRPHREALYTLFNELKRELEVKYRKEIDN